MDKESRIVFGIEDLVTVRFQCHKCKGEVAQDISAPESMPNQCPLCGHSWQTNEGLPTSAFINDSAVGLGGLGRRYVHFLHITQFLNREDENA